VTVISTIFWVVALGANVETSGSVAKANEGGDGVVEVKSTTVLFDALASGEMEYPLLTKAKGGIFDETDPGRLWRQTFEVFSVEVNANLSVRFLPQGKQLLALLLRGLFAVSFDSSLLQIYRPVEVVQCFPF